MIFCDLCEKQIKPGEKIYEKTRGHYIPCDDKGLPWFDVDEKLRQWCEECEKKLMVKEMETMRCHRCKGAIEPGEKVYEKTTGHVVEIGSDDLHGSEIISTLEQWCEGCEKKEAEDAD